MTALLILVFSSIALVRFAVSQWRAIWITAASQPLSGALQAQTGIDEANVSAQDFGALMGLCQKLSPALLKSSWLKEISLYYRSIAFADRAFSLPSLSAWARGEMQVCSRYVAVVLDQNLSMQHERELAAHS